MRTLILRPTTPSVMTPMDTSLASVAGYLNQAMPITVMSVMPSADQMA